jgi:predicted nucleotidyltransferase
MTADVDVTVELPAPLRPRFVAAMADAGFALRVADPEEFVRRSRVLPFEHRRTRMPLDVVLAGPGLEELFLSRAHRVPLAAGQVVPVLSPTDLVVTKLLAGRAKDLDDIRGVLRRQGDAFDRALARATVRDLEAALDQRDLLPLLERLLAESPPAQ